MKQTLHFKQRKKERNIPDSQTFKAIKDGIRVPGNKFNTEKRVLNLFSYAIVVIVDTAKNEILTGYKSRRFFL